eukprot:6096743-Prymnesium_polylepis.1
MDGRHHAHFPLAAWPATAAYAQRAARAWVDGDDGRRAAWRHAGPEHPRAGPQRRAVPDHGARGRDARPVLSVPDAHGAVGPAGRHRRPRAAGARGRVRPARPGAAACRSASRLLSLRAALWRAQRGVR